MIRAIVRSNAAGLIMMLTVDGFGWPAAHVGLSAFEACPLISDERNR